MLVMAVQPSVCVARYEFISAEAQDRKSQMTMWTPARIDTAPEKNARRELVERISLVVSQQQRRPADRRIPQIPLVELRPISVFLAVPRYDDE